MKKEENNELQNDSLESVAGGGFPSAEDITPEFIKKVKQTPGYKPEWDATFEGEKWFMELFMFINQNFDFDLARSLICKFANLASQKYNKKVGH